ncbi:MAG: aminotransferase class I/II-fold pyridoxal phosphate-dependent enzyme [Leptolyngbyaceae cyanobacterium MO_188.B28]|nr:aminotransferase class I/II-fold pyridoxal phosphate-dependent enzyme [Leptolyngbyaceae cyanobacterium MO_188.B28]
MLVSDKPLVIEGGKKLLNHDFQVTTLIPEEGINKAVEVMRTGKLYRYNCSVPDESEVSLLEKEFADAVDAKYAVAVNSCGSAMYIALLCLGVKPGDKVLTPAFTFTAVPSAIVHAQAEPVLVECLDNYCVDPEDLERKITPDTKVFLLSHMRGHISHMDKITEICQKHGITLLEDCAHSLGALWNGRQTGRFGKIGCYSSQSNKILNSGEGGVLVTDDPLLYTKAVLYAGSIENYWSRHFAQTDYFEELQNSIPNFSLRMSNLTAALIRPQLANLEERLEDLNSRYFELARIASTSEYIDVPDQYPQVRIAADTIQFNLLNFTAEEALKFTHIMGIEGIPTKVFGYLDNPRYFPTWKYINNIGEMAEGLPHTKEFLAYACDIRLPCYLTMDDIQIIGDTLLRAVRYVKNSH